MTITLCLRQLYYVCSFMHAFFTNTTPKAICDHQTTYLFMRAQCSHTELLRIDKEFYSINSKFLYSNSMQTIRLLKEVHITPWQTCSIELHLNFSEKHPSMLRLLYLCTAYTHIIIIIVKLLHHIYPLNK